MRNRGTASVRRTFVALLAGTLACVAPLPARAGSKLRIGYCTTDLEKAKAGGFDYAEPAVRSFARMSEPEFEDFLARRAKLKIEVPAGNVFLPNELNLTGPAVPDEALFEYVTRAFARARRLGMEIVVLGSGRARRAPEGYAKEAAFAQLVAFGKRLAPLARKYGLTVAVEPLRREETNVINTTAEGLALVEAVGHPNFGLTVDLFHLASANEDPEIVVKAGKHVKHVHISNPSGRLFPMDASEYDYESFFAALRAIRYRGRISVEGLSDQPEVEGRKAVAFLRAAYARPTKTTQAPPRSAITPFERTPKPAGP